MITNEEKEQLINNIIRKMEIKKTNTFFSDFHPIVYEDYNELKARIENERELTFEGFEISDVKIVKDKNKIFCKNCDFTELKFRNFTCEDVVFINCRFRDFSIVGGNYPNITFIACKFERFEVRSAEFISLVNLQGMTMIRCEFDNDSRISSANLNGSKWLDTDINDIEIIIDYSSPKKCTINDYIGDDFRKKSNIFKDVADVIKNADVKTLEKEIISNKEYQDEEIDIKLFINTDVCNCKFIDCIFVSDEFEKNNLLNFDMRCSFNNTHFYNCTFKCNLKGILFNNCKFEIGTIDNSFFYCIFNKCNFIEILLGEHTIINHSIFIDCTPDSKHDITSLCGSERGVEASVCQSVHELKSIETMETEIQKLQEEKNKAIENYHNIQQELLNVEELKANYAEILTEKSKLTEDNRKLTGSLDMKEIEIKELHEKLELIDKQYEIKINDIKSDYEETIKSLKLQLTEKPEKEHSDEKTNNYSDDLLIQILNIIKKNTNIFEQFVPEVPPVDTEMVTSFLAKLDENKRMEIFSKAAIERMRNSAFKSIDGTSSIAEDKSENC